MHHSRKFTRRIVVACAMVGGSIGGLSPAVFSGGNAAAAGAPIVVKGVYQAADYPGMAAGFEARITRFNKAGGIEGRKIKSLGVVDDGGTANTDLPIIQAAIDEDHVTAITPTMTDGFSGASITFANQHKTPYVGWGPLPWWCGDNWGFGIDGCIIPPAGITSEVLAAPLEKIIHKPPSQVTIAIDSIDIPGESDASLTVASDFEAAGYKIVLNAIDIPVVPPTSYTPEVTEILAVHPDVVFLNTAFAQGLGLGAALKAAGYTGYLYNPVGYAEGLLSSPNVAAALNGEVVNNFFPTNEETKNPAIIQIHKDLKAIGKDQPITLGVSIGYWSADMFIQMLQNAVAKHQPLTGAGIQKAANEGFTYKTLIKGGNAPQTFPAAHIQTTECTTMLEAKGSAYKVLAPYACYKTLKFTGTMLSAS